MMMENAIIEGEKISVKCKNQNAITENAAIADKHTHLNLHKQRGRDAVVAARRPTKDVR